MLTLAWTDIPKAPTLPNESIYIDDGSRALFGGKV